MLIALLIEHSLFTFIVQEPQYEPITGLILASIDRLCPHAAICHKNDVKPPEDVSEQGNSDTVPCCGGMCFLPLFIRTITLFLDRFRLVKEEYRTLRQIYRICLPPNVVSCICLRYNWSQVFASVTSQFVGNSSAT